MVNISTYFENPRPAKKRYSKRLFSEAADVVVSGEPCMRKWLKLEAKYRGRRQQQTHWES